MQIEATPAATSSGKTTIYAVVGIITLFFGIFGAIPAALLVDRARRDGLPSKLPWKVFASVIAAQLGLAVLAATGIAIAGAMHSNDAWNSAENQFAAICPRSFMANGHEYTAGDSPTRYDNRVEASYYRAQTLKTGIPDFNITLYRSSSPSLDEHDRALSWRGYMVVVRPNPFTQPYDDIPAILESVDSAFG